MYFAIKKQFLYLGFSLFFILPTAFAETKFLVITDIHYGADNKAEEGEDTGPQLLDTTLKKMAQLSNNVDFIVNLGDLPTHMFLFTSKKEEYERTLFHKLYEADSYKKPMFYIPGNNDSFGGNYQPFVVDGKSPLNAADDWDGACLYCKDLLIDKTHMSTGGFYSSYVIPNNKELLLIALNSAPFVNVPVLALSYPNQEADADEELSWLEQQLKSHSAKQLLIAMHVPPGMSYKGKEFWNTEPLQRFISIVERYSSSYGQITLLTGHTHMDELRKLPLKNGSALYDYSTAAVSTIHHNNPAMKVVSLDKDMAVTNYTTYYTSNLNNWGNEHYQAVGSTDAIFPNCKTKTLAQCLDSLSTKEVCAQLDGGFFVGAKSKRVKDQRCENTYIIK